MILSYLIFSVLSHNISLILSSGKYVNSLLIYQDTTFPKVSPCELKFLYCVIISLHPLPPNPLRKCIHSLDPMKGLNLQESPYNSFSQHVSFFTCRVRFLIAFNHTLFVSCSVKSDSLQLHELLPGSYLSSYQFFSSWIFSGEYE